MKLGICVVFILIANTLLAQESPRTRLNGKINANFMDLEEICLTKIILLII